MAPRPREPYAVRAKYAGVIKENVKEICSCGEAISEHACREFSIERSARVFLDAIRAVMREDE